MDTGDYPAAAQADLDQNENSQPLLRHQIVPTGNAQDLGFERCHLCS